MSYSDFYGDKHESPAYQRGIARRIEQNRAKTANAKRAAWLAADPTRCELVAKLDNAMERSQFAASLFTAYSQWGTLSEKQEAAARKMFDPAEIAAKQAARIANAPKVDLSTIHAMFDAAKASGLKRLVYRADGLSISPAKATSANAGSLYVKSDDGAYLGKVTGTAFLCTREATDTHKATLNTIAANPSQAARDYGKRTGVCCVCGIELTDPKSIEAGIGPVCAKKWRL